MTELYVNNQRVELNSDIPIPLNLQAVDVKELDSRRSEFTKTIAIPATKGNNKIFNNLFNLAKDNSVGFDPNLKSNATLRKGAFQIDGYLQVMRIVDGTYDAVFYGNFANIITDITGKQMSELSLNLDHTVTTESVVDSWDDEDFLYPLADYGSRNIRSESRVNIYHLKPAVKLKKYIDAIFADSGYTFSSSFFDSEDFGRLYVPYNGEENLLPTEEEMEAKGVVATNNLEEGMEALYPANGDTMPGTSLVYEANEDVIGSGNLVANSFKVPQDGVYDFESIHHLRVKTRYIGTRTTNRDWEWGLQQHFARIWMRVRDADGIEVTDDRVATAQSIYRTVTDTLDNVVVVEDNEHFPTGFVDIASRNQGGDIEGSRVARRSETSWAKKGAYEFQYVMEGLQLEEGDEVWMEAQFYSPYADSGSAIRVKNTPGSSPTTDDAYQAMFNIDTVSRFTVLPNPGVALDIDATYEDFALVEVTQREFLLAVLRMFNLVMIPHPAKTNHFIIERRDDYFAEGTVKDWSNKLDYSRTQTLQPTTEPNVDSYRYTFNKGEDYYNTRYQEIEDRVYGDVVIGSLSEFGSTEKTNDIIFEPPIVVKHENDKVYGLVFECTSINRRIWEVQNTDDLRLITGYGQKITLMIDSVPRTATIVDVSEKSLTLSAGITGHRTNTLYGAIIDNTFNRLSLPFYKLSDDNVKQETLRTNPRIYYYVGLQYTPQYSLYDGADSLQLEEYPVLHHFNDLDEPTFDYLFGRPNRVFFELGDAPTLGLKNWYRFENSGNQLLDSMGNDHGSLLGNPDIVTGVAGNARRFNVPDEVEQRGQVNNYSLNTEELTLSAWVWLEHDQTSRDIIYIGQDMTQQIVRLRVSASQTPQINRWFSGGNHNMTSDVHFPSREWVHIVGTVGDFGSRVYMNGTLVGENPANTRGLDAVNGHMRISQWRDERFQVQGIIDEVRIYERALTHSEVKQLYNSPAGNISYPTENLFSYHRATLEEKMEGNIFTAYFDLSIADLVNLRYNDKLFINGVYYRVNRIVDFDLNFKRPVKVELFRL